MMIIVVAIVLCNFVLVCLV